MGIGTLWQIAARAPPPEPEPVITSDQGPVIRTGDPVTNPPFTYRGGTLIPGARAQRVC